MHLSLKYKIWFSLAAVVLFFTFFILYYFPKKQATSLRNHYESEIQNLADITANDVNVSLEKMDYSGMITALSMVKVDPRFHFISLDLDTSNSGRIDHIATIRSESLDTTGGISLTSNADQIVKSAELPGKTHGRITLAYGTAEIKRSIREIRYTSILFSAFVLLIGFAATYIFTKKFTMPVYALRDAAIKVGQGDHSQRIKVTRTDEIGELERAFNKMVTDLSTSQAQLVQSEKLASLGQLTAGVAHEINNPINFVSSNIPSLKRDIEDILALLDKYAKLDTDNFATAHKEIEDFSKSIDLPYTITEIKALLKGIEEGATRTAAIVKGLRNFSRQEDEEMRSANINEGIESTLMLIHNKLQHKKITVTKDLGAIPEIRCFPGQLNQVFMNLISNAADAIAETGEIAITTAQRDGHVVITIKDSGSGMDERTRSKLFDPFFTTKPVGQGTGLGLSVSHGIIQKHSGRIDVRSELGVGTEFSLWLPIDPPKGPAGGNGK